MFLGILETKNFQRTIHSDLRSSGSRPGINYGLVKVHKIVTGTSPYFQPLLLVICTPTYKLTKFLVSLL